MKKILIGIVICILVFGLGIICGFYSKTLIDENKLIGEKEKQSSIANLMSEEEINKLKETIEKDEKDYGDNYQSFKENFPYIYKSDPDRIYFKSSKVGVFYVFEKDDENYKHLLEVVEDRMHYSVIDDYNLRCFWPETINKMITSEKNYIVFDYDNEGIDQFDKLYNKDYNKDLVFSFSSNTRLYRLVTYLSYYKESILKEDLPKREFADDTNVTGFQYMQYEIKD